MNLHRKKKKLHIKKENFKWKKIIIISELLTIEKKKIFPRNIFFLYS